MSHFVVLVTGDNAEHDLVPYDENIEHVPHKVDCGCVQHRVFVQSMKHTSKKFGFKNWGAFRDDYNAMPETDRPEWSEYIKDWVAFEKEEKARLFKFYKPLVTCEDCKGTGQRITTYNPHAKWDWYELGGRWRGFFKLKEGVVDVNNELGNSGVHDNSADFDVDTALKGDIDFEGMKKTIEEQAGHSWDDATEMGGKEPTPMDKDGKKNMGFLEKELYTREEYIRQSGLNLPYSIVHEGIWYQKGDMGWWGMSSNENGEWETEATKLIEGFPDDLRLSIYDLHI